LSGSADDASYPNTASIAIVLATPGELVFRAMQTSLSYTKTKTHEEFVQLAADSAQLTPEAHTALASELARCRIDVGKHLNAGGESDQGRIEQPSTRGRLSLNALAETISAFSSPSPKQEMFPHRGQGASLRHL
jgi:hypothetical protein